MQKKYKMSSYVIELYAIQRQTWQQLVFLNLQPQGQVLRHMFNYRPTTIYLINYIWHWQDNIAVP